jgi:type I restriction enzyme S subunit
MEVKTFLPFEELFEVPLRNGLTKPKAVRGSGVKMVNMGEVFANSRIHNLGMDRVPLEGKERINSMLRAGDLLFARQSLVRAGAGKCCLFIGDLEDVTFESHIIRCRLNSRRAEPAYYFYLFQSRAGRDLVEAIIEQVAAAGIRGSDLAKLKVPVPPLPLQKAIAAVLGALDDKIEVNRRMNATLEAMARALFQSWFVDFDPVRAKAGGRHPARLNEPTAALFPAQFQDSELGEIPVGWKMSKLKDLTSKIGSGATPRGGKEVYVNEGPALIRSQNVHDHELRWEGLARLTEKSAAELKNVDVRRDDVLLNITGDSILRTCVVDPSALPSRVNQHVAIIRAISGIPSRYLHLYLVQPSVKSLLLGLSAGATRHAITKGHLEAVEVLHPPADVLAAFERITTPWFERVDNNREQSRTLATLRDTLLPKLLSGALSVRESEALTEELSI